MTRYGEILFEDIHSQTIQQAVTEINTSEWNEGMYFFILTEPGKTNKTFKLVKSY
jgi:hypothetical protein